MVLLRNIWSVLFLFRPNQIIPRTKYFRHFWFGFTFSSPRTKCFSNIWSGYILLCSIGRYIGDDENNISNKYAHSSHPDKPSTGSAIYIQNHHYHFEPVVELDFTQTPSFDIGTVGTCTIKGIPGTTEIVFSNRK